MNCVVSNSQTCYIHVLENRHCNVHASTVLVLKAMYYIDLLIFSFYSSKCYLIALKEGLGAVLITYYCMHKFV
jgi:hypothetical protein